ncbi:hypothetical protein [Rhizobium sp. SAFR-030]|uniref:hypothetical protein n=1 Tax=Rhizobium sp. SAFR-030 TaxID=3387277 RepID=UPI003F813C29
MSDYQLTCTNHSRMHGCFVLFGVPPRIDASPHIVSIAWRVRPAAPGTSVTFAWSDTLSFVWGERHLIGRRRRFRLSEEVIGDFDRDNAIDIDRDDYGAPAFANLRTDGTRGALTIRQLNARFEHMIYHGVALGGAPLLISRFHANVTTDFIVEPGRIFVHFGDQCTGEAIEPDNLGISQLVEFSPSRPSRSVILGPDNIIRPSDRDD